MTEPVRLDLKKLKERFSTAELVVAAGSLVLLVGLFLDWVSYSCSGAFCSGGGAGVSGFHSWGWLTFLALVGVAGLLVVRRLLVGKVELPELPLPDAMLIMIGGGLEIAGCLFFWLGNHGSFASVTAGPISYSFGLGFGWFVALVAGIATVVGGYLMSQAPQASAMPMASEAPPLA